MTRSQQWDAPNDIANALRRILTGRANGLSIQDDGMDTRYSDLKVVDEYRLEAFDEILGRRRTIELREIRSMLEAGDAYIVGGAGEAKHRAALGRRTGYPTNPFGSKHAVIETAKRIASERGEHLSPMVIDALREMSETDLVQSVMRYAGEAGYALEADLGVARPTMN